MLDFLLAISMLVVLSPALLVVAILIKLTSTGPIFFKHTRYGFYGKQFELYKFRTMYENAHKDQNKLSHNNIRKDGLFKMKNDPRVTKFGLFLRKTSIDELPSLVNVIRGEIGFIGPRAYSIKLKDYKDCQRRRLSVLPGMTCLTQAYDRNSYSNFIEKDLHYLDSWSPRLDIQIFFKTISTVLHGTGE
ncbi:MAG: sugar transferase [Bacteroidetes bacterium]|nr:sugar transferase [Bacteroidota bacterium]